MFLSLCVLDSFLVKILVFIMSINISSSEAAASRKIHTYRTAEVMKEAHGTGVVDNNSGLETTTWMPPAYTEKSVHSRSKDNNIRQRSFSSIPTISNNNNNNTGNQYFSPVDTVAPLYSEHNANSSLIGVAPYELNHLLTNYYNNSDYYYNENSSFYDTYLNKPSKRDAQVSTLSLHGKTSYPDEHAPADSFGPYQYSAETNSAYDTAPSYSHYQSDGLQYTYGHTAQPQRHGHEGEHHSQESFEIEDKVFSKTVVATKALKVGKIVMTFFMVLVVLVIACLGKLGVTVSPVILPLALLPVGVIALLLFIPLFLLFIPLAATGLAGEKRKRRRRDINQVKLAMERDNFMDNILVTLEDQLPRILDKIAIVDYWQD